MAARTKRTNLDSKWREKIQTSMLLNRLMDNALGNLPAEMSPSQVRSAEILLRKSLPDLSSVDIEAGDETVGRIVRFITGFSNPSGGPKRG